MNKILKKIEENNKIALFQHINPDGDSITSSYGLGLAIKEKYPNKEVVICADHAYLAKYFKFLDIDKSMFVDEIDDSYLAIIGDVSVLARIVNNDQIVKAKEIVCYDHHQNETDIVPAPTVFWHEPGYPASAIQACEMAKTFGIDFSEETSIYLILGILTDTGFFKYSAANPRPLEIVADLFHNISDPRMNALYKGFQTRTKKDLAITAYILQNIVYYKNVAYVMFDKETVDKYGHIPLKIKVNSIGNIEGSDIWGFFINDINDEGEEIWACNLRSSGPKIVTVAKKWGGGGHFKACGARVKTKENVMDLIEDLTEITEYV